MFVPCRGSCRYPNIGAYRDSHAFLKKTSTFKTTINNMDLEDLPNTDNRYGFRLKINSEEDLFEMDEATGAKKYTL